MYPDLSKLMPVGLSRLYGEAFDFLTSDEKGGNWCADVSPALL